jgi:hypothetical protein
VSSSSHVSAGKSLQETEENFLNNLIDKKIDMFKKRASYEDVLDTHDETFSKFL